MIYISLWILMSVLVKALHSIIFWDWAGGKASFIQHIFYFIAWPLTLYVALEECWYK